MSLFLLVQLPFLKLRSLIATSSLCKLVKMADHDQLCGHTGGVVPIGSDCWDGNFFVQAQHYEQLWLELVTPSCHPPSPWTRAPCPVLGVQKDCNCNHESHVLICFKALFTPACKFLPQWGLWLWHSDSNYDLILTRFFFDNIGSYKIDLLTSSAAGIFVVKFILV